MVKEIPQSCRWMNHRKVRIIVSSETYLWFRKVPVQNKSGETMSRGIDTFEFHNRRHRRVVNIDYESQSFLTEFLHNALNPTHTLSPRVSFSLPSRS